MKNTIIIIAAFVLISVTSFAQKGKYGATKEDSVKCIISLSLYQEYYKQKSYKDALPGWRKACEVCPKASKNLYIHGAKMYKQKAKKEKDPVAKQKHIDTLMTIYDNRIKAFGQEGYVLSKKGSDLMRFRKTSYKEANVMLSKAFELEGNKLSAGALVYLYKSQYKMFRNKEADKESLLNLYPKVAAALEYNIAHQKKPKTIENYRNSLNNVEIMFSKVANCPDLIALYTPKFEANPTDTILLENITKLLIKKECTSEKLFMDAAIALHKVKPSPESAYNLGKMMAKKGNCNEAITYFKQATKHESKDAQVNAYMAMAKCSYNLKQYTQVRTYCLKALAVNPKIGEAYLLIGDVYTISAKKCGSDACKSKAAYWVAVDKYQKAKAVDSSVAAKANSKIAAAKAQYPKKSDCFFYSLKSGDTYKVECWINETTTVRVQ